MKTILTIWILAATLLISCSATRAGEAVWTGLGTDDRWCNPDNWQCGQLPSSGDDVVFEPADWTTRQQSVTIDTVATANNLHFYHYAQHNYAFQNIYITSGADFSINNEYIDQSNYAFGTYSMNGGEHVVNGNFSYRTQGGSFSMTAGVLDVWGTLSLCPEHGYVDIHGGTITTARLALFEHFFVNKYDFSGPAYINVLDEFCISSLNMLGFSPFSCSLDYPIRMSGANFVNKQDYYSGGAKLIELNGLDLIFDGGLADISTFEIAGCDYGPDLAGMQDNFAIGDLQIGDAQPGYLQLVDDFANQFGDEALYVDALIMGNGSVLDLNGYNLYYNTLVELGDYEILNGTPTPIPEPSMICLLGFGALFLIRKRN